MNPTNPLQAVKIVEQIKPLLAGNPPDIQGAILAELTAIWVVGHPPKVRSEMLSFQCRMIEKFIPVEDRILFGDAGHPQREQTNN